MAHQLDYENYDHLVRLRRALRGAQFAVPGPSQDEYAPHARARAHLCRRRAL